MESLRNGRGIWKVRAIPRWQMASGVRPAISSPRNRMEPAVRGRAPETQLNAVVLPEPFGPMSPRISPSRTSYETALRAVKPPNRLVSPLTVSMRSVLWGVASRGCRPHAAGAVSGGRPRRSRRICRRRPARRRPGALICTAQCRTFSCRSRRGDTMPRADAQTKTSARPARSERLEARISRAQKDLFVRAADLQGRSLTDFVVVSAQEAALQTVRAHDALRLSERDREAFVSALLTPSAPAKTLQRAARRYRERTGL